MMRFCLFTAIFGCAIITFASAVPYYCPVVGLPEAKACCCPSGYCPRKVNKEVTVEYKGAKLELCASCCIKPFKATPDKFAVAANHQLVATKQAKQVKCPICGGKADPATTLDIAGIQVAFCSDGCSKKIADAKPAERPNQVFANDAFGRGFTIVASKAK